MSKDSENKSGWEVFAEMVNSTIVLTIVVVTSLTGAVIYLSCVGKEIPQIVETLTWVSYGVAFGGKLPELLTILANRVKMEDE